MEIADRRIVNARLITTDLRHDPKFRLSSIRIPSRNGRRTNEKDFLFHDLVIRLSLVAETAAGSQQLSRSRVSFLKSRANIASDCTQSCRHLRFAFNSRDCFFGKE